MESYRTISQKIKKQQQQQQEELNKFKWSDHH